MLLATALACLLQDVLNRRLLFKTNRRSSTRNHHPSFLRFWNWAETVDAAKICGDIVKASQQTFVNGLLGFITLNIILRWKRIVYCSQ